MKEKHLKCFFSFLQLVSGFLVVFYQLLRRKVQKTTSEFCSISEVIDFLNVFIQSFTEKVLRWSQDERLNFILPIKAIDIEEKRRDKNVVDMKRDFIASN